jgi:antitoxin (DNA-binding transcriptional repressor) of toxin-antitoxin stability system
MASFVALQEAQEKLAELIDRAKGGEEIVIERDGKAAAKLVAVPAETPAVGKRVFGQNFLGVTYVDPNWDAPMSEEELNDWAPPRRTLAECIAMLPEDSTATVDEGFARDVEAAIKSHREPADASAWD